MAGAKRRSLFNSNPRPDPYTDEITLEDIEKMAEKVFNGSYPRKLANNLWRLSPSCIGNDKALELLLNLATKEPGRQSPPDYEGSNGITISFDNKPKPKTRRCKKDGKA